MSNLGKKEISDIVRSNLEFLENNTFLSENNEFNKKWMRSFTEKST